MVKKVAGCAPQKASPPLRRAKPSAGSASQERKLCCRNSPFLPCFRAAGKLNPSAARGACRQCALSGPTHAVRSARPLCPGTAPGRPARALSGEGARMAHSSTFGAWLKAAGCVPQKALASRAGQNRLRAAPLGRESSAAGTALPCFRAAGKPTPSTACGAYRKCALSELARAVRSTRPLYPGAAPGRPARALLR